MTTFSRETLLEYLKLINVEESVILNATPDLRLLETLMLAHTVAIPFENLSVLVDEFVSLELDDLVEKFVKRRRGGCCFEMNIFFATVLRTLGFNGSFLETFSNSI